MGNVTRLKVDIISNYDENNNIFFYIGDYITKNSNDKYNIINIFHTNQFKIEDYNYKFTDYDIGSNYIKSITEYQVNQLEIM